MMRMTGVVSLLLLLAAGTGAAADTTALSGFVDASYSGNLDTKVNTFGLDQIEIDVIHEIGGNGLVRADVEWVKDGDEWAQDLEQGYLAYVPEFSAAWTFTLGKFNAPIGFELLDAPDMFQFSHALVFDYGLPTNLTGLMAAVELGDGFDAAAYVVNGWDDNDRPDDSAKTVGGRLGYDFGEMGGCGVSAITGREYFEEESDLFERTVFDVDLTLAPAAGWIIGGEFNTGKITVADVESEWTGLLLMVHYDFNQWLGLTGRFDSFDDKDGAVFEAGLAQTRSAFTIAPTFVLGDGMGALLELRIDTSDEAVFEDGDGEPSDSTTSAAFEVTFAF